MKTSPGPALEKNTANVTYDDYKFNQMLYRN